MPNTMKHRAFGEGRQEEIEGYVTTFMDWVGADRDPDGPMLDVGTNYGWALAYANDKWGVHGVGIDLTPQWVLRPSPVLIPADVGEFLPTLPSGLFGLVVFCHSLEHLPNYMQALSEAWRLLQRNGMLAIAVPHPKSVDWMPQDGGHLTLFTPEFLAQRVRDVTQLSPVRFERQITLRLHHDETWGVWIKP